MPEPTASSDVYSHGHHRSVLASHSRRTAENSAAYLLDSLRPQDRLLDIGCGPGTITIDLSARLTRGEVIGVDNVEEPLVAAREAARQAGDTRVTFRQADVYALDFPDDAFDVVHAHQVLQHLSDPIAALREMARVTKPGGLIAARDADYAMMTWFPDSPGLDRWLDLYHRLARSNHAEPDGGRRLKSWALAAGLEQITASASTWCYASEEDRQAWGLGWVDRVRHSDFARQVVDRALATPEDLEELATAWREWTAAPDGWFCIVHGEILCRVHPGRV